MTKFHKISYFRLRALCHAVWTRPMGQLYNRLMVLMCRHGAAEKRLPGVRLLFFNSYKNWFKMSRNQDCEFDGIDPDLKNPDPTGKKKLDSDTT